MFPCKSHIMEWSWVELRWVHELRWVEMSWVELSWVEMRWVELRWVELRWVELRWVEMSWVELRMNWVDGWVEMSWVELRWIEISWDQLSWENWFTMRPELYLFCLHFPFSFPDICVSFRIAAPFSWFWLNETIFTPGIYNGGDFKSNETY